MIPWGVELFALDASFLGFLPVKQIHGHAPEACEVFRRMPFPGTAVILAHDHVENPVTGVFHAPVTPDGAGEQPDIQLWTGEEIPSFHSLLGADDPGAFHHACGAQTFP